jgi:hypothetical protein
MAPLREHVNILLSAHIDEQGRPMENVNQLRIDLAAAYRWAVRFGLHEGISNHFSVALDDDTFLINPHGLHW